MWNNDHFHTQWVEVLLFFVVILALIPIYKMCMPFDSSILLLRISSRIQLWTIMYVSGLLFQNVLLYRKNESQSLSVGVVTLWYLSLEWKIRNTLKPINKRIARSIVVYSVILWNMMQRFKRTREIHKRDYGNIDSSPRSLIRWKKTESWNHKYSMVNLYKRYLYLCTFMGK